MTTPIWAARLDNAYNCEVILTEDGRSASITIEENGEVIYDEPTVMVFEPRFGPDVADVACWENQIIEFIDGRGAQE